MAEGHMVNRMPLSKLQLAFWCIARIKGQYNAPYSALQSNMRRATARTLNSTRFVTIKWFACCNAALTQLQQLLHTMLGLRFGLLGGFAESDIAVVWTSLSAQLPAQATPTHAKAPTDSGATAAAAAAVVRVGAVACEDAAVSRSSKAAVAPAVPDQVATQNWQNCCLQVLH
jgi:hypothetical protein